MWSLKKVLSSFSVPSFFGGKEIIISASIGISLYPDDSEDIDTLMRLADDAMYQAKHSRKNTHHHDPSSLD